MAAFDMFLIFSLGFSIFALCFNIWNFIEVKKENQRREQDDKE